MHLMKTTIVFILSGICFLIQHLMGYKIKYGFDDKRKETLIDCVQKTIEINFIQTPTIVMNQNIPDDKTNKDDFGEKFTMELIHQNIPRIVSQEHINMNSIYMQEGYILMIKYIHHCESLVSLQIAVFEEHIKYLVIVFDYTRERCEYIFSGVGNQISMYDVTYILRNSEKDIEIATFIPKINETTCVLEYNLPPTILSTCKVKEKSNAFPIKKPQNFMQCPLKIGIASLFPFTKIPNKNELKTYDRLQEQDFDGSDLKILKIIAKYFNFTPEFYYIYRIEENPYVNKEFLKFVLNQSLDICAGGLYRIYGDVVDYSGVYRRQAVVWMYAVKRDPRSWQAIVSKLNGMYIFMIFYFLYSFIWKLFSIFDKQATTMGSIMLHTWGALIGTSSLKDGVSLKQKILNIVYLIMCIHFSAYISIQVFSFLTILAPPTIYKTNEDILLSGLQPYLKPTTKYFITDQAYTAFADTAKDCESFLDCEKKSLKFNGVTAIIDSIFTALQAETAVNDEATTLRVHENLLTIFHEILFRKDLPIKKRFQDIITMLRESGISDRLFDESIGMLTKSKSESAAKNMMSHCYSCGNGCSITLSQSAGAFYVWVLGCGLSFCMFVIEVILKIKRSRYC